MKMELIKTFHNSFNGNDTNIYKDKQSQFFIENSCQKFPKDNLFEVCEEYFVDLYYIEEIADTIGLSLKEYATQNPYEFYAKIYRAKYGTKEDLDLLFQDKNKEVREAVAQNPNVTKELLDILITDEHYYVRSSVAKSLNITQEHLNVLVKDKDWYVRAAVAESPNVTKEHLDILIGDEHYDVRAAAAQSTNVTKEHLNILEKYKQKQPTFIFRCRKYKATPYAQKVRTSFDI